MKTNGLFKMVRPLALLPLLLPLSCSKTVTYSFVDVSVQVDPSVLQKELAAKVDSCEVAVTGDESVEGVVIPCVSAAKIGYDLGSFEWTTTLEKGKLQFVVTLFALNREVYGTGTSAPVDIIAGKRASSSVVVVVAPTTTPGTGGAGVGGSSGLGGSSGVGGQGGTTAVGGQSGTATGGVGGITGQAGKGGTVGNGGKGGMPGQGGNGGGSAAGASGAGGAAVGGVSGSAGAGGLTGSAGAGGVAAGGANGGKGGAVGGAGGA